VTSGNKKIDALIRPGLLELAAYHVPESGDLIKLDAMENPYPWPEWLTDAWLEHLRGVALNRYPDSAARALKAALGPALGVPGTAGLLLGNGSDELIQMIIQAVAEPGRTILAPEPTFAMYRQIAAVCGLSYRAVPLDAAYALDPRAMLDAVEETRPAVVFLAYPNNPTGNLFDKTVIRDILSSTAGLVVIDEAYAPFTDESFLPDLPGHGNLLVLRTLSKMGLAGLRLGALAGAPDWLEQIGKTRLPYNISTLNQVTGEFALAHIEVFEGQAEQIRQSRGDLLQALQSLPGLTVYPSAANFILFRLPAGRAQEVFEGLQADGILVKNLHGSSAALADCLRVTVGRPEENTAFIAALGRLLDRT